MRKQFEDERTCKWCNDSFIVKARTKKAAKGKIKEFCSDLCRYTWHNEYSESRRHRNDKKT